jgi:hypothetical protein
MKLKSLHVFAAALVGSHVNLLGSTIVLSDDFSYPDGPLVIATGSPWVNHSGTANQVDVASGAVNLTFAESEDVNAPLTGQPYTSGFVSATFDVNFSALPSSGGSYFAHFKDASSGFRSRLTSFTSGATAGFFRLGINNDGGATIPVPTDLSLGTVYSVTMTWNLDTRQSTLSIDGGSSVVDTDAASAVTVTSFAFRQASGIGTMTVDNLSVSYIPEPTAALLGSLGLLGLLRRRRGH